MIGISDLQIGKAAEYLVCADLILKGYIAYPSEQGLPYDIVLDNGSRLIKVQVKATRRCKKIANSPEQNPFYVFAIGRNGKNQSRVKYETNDVDVFAVVALDTYEIGYIKNKDVRTTMNFRVSKFRGTYRNESLDAVKQEAFKLKEDGLSIPEIAKKLNRAEHRIYRFLDQQKKGTTQGKKGRYLTDYKIEDAWTA